MQPESWLIRWVLTPCDLPPTGRGRPRGSDVHDGYSNHLFWYRKKVGPLPDGFELDHLCPRKACRALTHLEVVTSGENKRRAHIRRYGYACKQGHLWSEDLYVGPNGRYQCKICRKAAMRRFDERHPRYQYDWWVSNRRDKGA